MKEDLKILEEYIDLINKGYCDDCNELNCIDNFPHKKIANAISNLIQAYKEQNTKIEYLQHRIEVETENTGSLATRVVELSKELEKKDKIIDLSVRELYKRAHISTKCYLQTNIEKCMKYKNCIECLKQYFENKVNSSEQH